MISKPVHVVLIHGTNATNAKWTREGSDLRLSICNHFRDHEIVFHVFNWSGDNSHNKRLQAGDALAELVNGLLDSDASVDIFLVAHSHGGNVGLYALDQLSPDAVKGMVCLAAPFFQVSQRDSQMLRTVLRYSLGLTWFLLWTGVLIVLEKSFPISGLFESLGDLGDFFLGAGLLLFITSTLNGGWMVISNVLKRIQEKGDSLGSRLQCPGIAVPVLALAYRADEAGIWLSFLQAFGHLIRSPWEQIVSIITSFLLDYGPLLFFSLFLFGGIATWLGWDGVLPHDANTFLEMLISFLTNSLLLVFVVVPSYLFSFYLIRTHPLGFGWDDFFLLADWQVHASAKPPGEIAHCQIEYIKLDPAKDIRALWLRHSYIYSDSSVHKRICQDIEECVFQAREKNQG